MRRTVLMATAVILLSAAGCRSGVDLSTPKGQIRFGVQAAKMDLWREAQFRFLRAVEMSPSDPMAYNNLAVAYEGIGEFELAREAYLRALQIDRSNQYIQRNYSRFVEFYSKQQSRAEQERSPGDAAADPDETDADAVPEEPEMDPDPEETETDPVPEEPETDPPSEDDNR